MKKLLKKNTPEEISEQYDIPLEKILELPQLMEVEDSYFTSCIL